MKQVSKHLHGWEFNSAAENLEEPKNLKSTKRLSKGRGLKYDSATEHTAPHYRQNQDSCAALIQDLQ